MKVATKHFWVKPVRRMRARAALLMVGTALSTLPLSATHAQVVATQLYALKGGAHDAANPEANVLADTSGPGGTVRSLYSSSINGGAPTQDCPNGCGAAFELVPPAKGKSSWTEKHVWLFPKDGGGLFPNRTGLSTLASRIIVTTPLYGSTTAGGSHQDGQVYSLTGKVLTPIWQFTGGADGASPNAYNVVPDASGVLFVATNLGPNGANCGAIAKLVPPAQGSTKWTETTIWVFSGAPDGCEPGELIEDASGRLFGTAFSGGSAGRGTAFELIPPAQGQTAWTEQTLWSFQDGKDGAQPGPLTEGPGGVLWGTSYFGGGNTGGGSCTDGCGTVFQLTPPKKGKIAWKEEILWAFTAGTDGRGPAAPMLADKTGALYSNTTRGAASNDGVVFKLTPPVAGQTSWTETTLYTFDGLVGAVPDCGMAADGNGVLYGTTVYGGTSQGYGVVFSLAGTGFVSQ